MFLAVAQRGVKGSNVGERRAKVAQRIRLTLLIADSAGEVQLLLEGADRRRLIAQQLATFRLALNPAKTRIVNYADGLEFLGQALVPRRRGPRWLDGARTFEEAQERLRASTQQVRRKLKP